MVTVDLEFRFANEAIVQIKNGQQFFEAVWAKALSEGAAVVVDRAGCMRFRHNRIIFDGDFVLFPSLRNQGRVSETKFK